MHPVPKPTWRIDFNNRVVRPVAIIVDFDEDAQCGFCMLRDGCGRAMW
jgi:hypothetical protein